MTEKRRKTQILWCLLGFTVALLAASPRARAAGRVAIDVDGPNGGRLRTELVSALPPGMDVIDGAKLGPALARQRVRNLGGEIFNARRRPALTAKLRRAARAIGADAIVVGAVPAGRGKGGLEMRVLVVRTARRGAAVDETIRFAKGESRAARWRALLGGALENLGAPAEVAAAAQTKAEDEAAAREEEAQEAAGGHDGKDGKDGKDSKDSKDGQDSRTSQEGREGEADAETSDESGEAAEAEGSAQSGRATATDALVVGFVGLDFGGRQFHYNERITEANLRPYDLPSSVLLPISPGGALSGEIYPLARSSAGWARDIGVVVSGRYNVAKAKLGTVTLDTSWYAWEANLRGRYHLGARGASPAVGLEIGLGRQVFEFKGNAAVKDILPGVNYHYLRFGADGRVPLGKVDLMVGAAFRHLQKEAGSVGKHFPRASIAGLDAKIGAAYQLTQGLEARLMLTYVRFWATFNSRVGDPYIAGGGLDQMLHADLGIAAVF